jgi:hypothetical protein
MERVLLWQVSVSQASRRQFQNFRKFLWSFQLSKSRIHCFHPDSLVKRPDALLCREDSDSSVCIRPDVRATRPDTFQCSRRIQISFADTDRERQLAIIWTLEQHCPDASLIRKHVKRVMERWLHSSPSERSLLPSRPRLEKSESVAI